MKSKREEVLEAFRPTKEPIVVEITQRPTSKSTVPSAPKVGMEADSATSPSSSFIYCDSCTQTEWTGGWESPPIGLFPFSQNNLMQSTGILFGNEEDVEHHYETLEEAFGHEDDDDEVTCELEYEVRNLHAFKYICLHVVYLFTFVDSKIKIQNSHS